MRRRELFDLMHEMDIVGQEALPQQAALEEVTICVRPVSSLCQSESPQVGLVQC